MLIEFAHLAAESALNKLLDLAAPDRIAPAARRKEHLRLVVEALDSIQAPLDDPGDEDGDRDARG